MTEISIAGANQLDSLGRAFKQAGDGGKELRKELLRGLRTAGKPLIAEVRRSAASELPQSGGLASLVSRSKFSTRTRLSGKNVGIRIEGNNGRMRGLRGLDAGRLRHPVFGNRDTWVGQSVTPGWFSKPIEHDLPAVRGEIQHVMNDVAAKIERSV